MEVSAPCLALVAALVVALVLAVVALAARSAPGARLRAGLRAGSHSRRTPLRSLRPAEVLRPRTFDEFRREVDALVARAAELEEFGPQSRLSDACRAAVQGGKRLRPVILLEVARATAALRPRAWRRAAPDAAEAALAIEYLHAASLVIDDSPAFDDDASRRGRPSLHVVAGPAVAQMAALSLVACAFVNFGRQVDWLRANCPGAVDADRIGSILCGEVGRALGPAGAAGGQYMDLCPAGVLLAESGPNAVAEITYRKTATFFEIAVVAGWLVAGGAPDKVGTARRIGAHVGTAFQISDDIGDAERDAARAARGKPGWNFANSFGRDTALGELERHLGAARRLLEAAGLWSEVWRDEIFPLIYANAAPAAPDASAALGAPASAVAAPNAAPDATLGAPVAAPVAAFVAAPGAVFGSVDQEELAKSSIPA